MTKHNKLSRRRFLIGTSAVAGTTIAACSGLGVLATLPPAIDFKESSYQKENNMTEKILVTYASRAGATGEVADAIGRELGKSGFSVDVRQVKYATDLSEYSAVVLGSAIYMGGWMSDATKFVEKYRETVSQMPFATFTVSMLMVDRPTEHQALIANHFTESEQQPRLHPVSNGIFAGRIDTSKLPIFHRSIAKMMKAEEEDRRDWEAIRAWTGELAAHLVPA